MSFNTLEKSKTNSKPFELLLFTAGTQEFRYTTGPRQYMHSDGKMYEPLGTKRGSIGRANKSNKSLKIKVPGNNPVAQLFNPYAPSEHVGLRIFRINGKESIVAWVGKVIGPSWKNTFTVCELECQSILTGLERSGLRDTYQYNCVHYLYQGGCKLNIDDWSRTVTVGELRQRGRVIYCPELSEPEGYYLAGVCAFGPASQMITGYDSVEKTITLLAAIEGMEEGMQIKVAKGCDRTMESCKSFGNQINHLGFKTLPSRNPFQDGLDGVAGGDAAPPKFKTHFYV